MIRSILMILCLVICSANSFSQDRPTVAKKKIELPTGWHVLLDSSGSYRLALSRTSDGLTGYRFKTAADAFTFAKRWADDIERDRKLTFKEVDAPNSK